MAHRNRAEQRTWKARKDPRKLAKRTKPHEPKPVYCRRATDSDLKEVLSVTEYD